MKNKPLAVQIWFVFAGIMVGISLLLLLLVPFVLNPFLTKEFYTRIEDAQSTRWDLMQEQLGVPDVRHPSPHAVRHIFLNQEGSNASDQRPAPGPSELIALAKEQAKDQGEPTKEYKKDIGGQTYYYVIRKGEIKGQTVQLLSFMGGAYQKDLVRTIVKQIAVVIAMVLIVSWPPSLLLAKYLSRSLVNMEKQVERIANRDWNEPLVMNRKDEIGRLAGSIEHMRQRLVQQDEAQRSFLQNISHELKTPIMVIQSYTQSIQDGIYPKGNLSETVSVIEEESDRLKNLVQKLLYMTKLDYLAARDVLPAESVHVIDLLQRSVDRLRWQRPDINWGLEFRDLSIKGDREQLSVAIENILDNQIRYAVSEIRISMEEGKGEKKLILRFWNDGQAIEEEILSTLFKPFEKGGKGQFGLGLSIVKRIVDLHHGEIMVRNEEQGVAFYLKLPL